MHSRSHPGAPEPVLIALGANLGDPEAQLAEAVRRLGRVVRVLRVSHAYRTEPVGAAGQPDYLNAVCLAETALEPAELLDRLLAIEREMGRVRGARNAARTLDLDLLAYGDRVLDTERLRLPHPRMTERAFVLAPLAEIAPEWRHPVAGATARELLRAAGPLERVERLGPLPAAPSA